MSHANAQGVPQELTIGRITIAGIAPTSVLTSLSQLLTRKGAPDYSLIKSSVRVLLDESALAIEPLESKEAPILILNYEDQALVRWAKSQKVQTSWYYSSDSQHNVGAKHHEYRGTYYRDPRNLIYSNESGLEVYPLGSSYKATTELLAAVCTAREGGLSPDVLRKALES
jgi:hypothetical protein